MVGYDLAAFPRLWCPLIEQPPAELQNLNFLLGAETKSYLQEKCINRNKFNTNKLNEIEITRYFLLGQG